MVTTVTAIYRYPVKGLSAEKMDRVALMPGECLPHDRRIAIALGSTRFDAQRPEWLSKTHFIMLMRDERVAQLQTRFDAESGVLTIAEHGRVLLRGQMSEPRLRSLELQDVESGVVVGEVDHALHRQSSLRTG